MLEFSEWFSFVLCQIFGLAVMSGCVVIAVFWCADQVYRRLRISFLILHHCLVARDYYGCSHDRTQSHIL